MINFYKVSITFLMHKMDLLPASKQSGANFHAYRQYSRIAGHVASLPSAQHLQRDY